MNERLEALWNRLRRRVDQAVIVGLAVLLGITLVLYWIEQEVPEPIKPNVPPPPIETPPASWAVFRQDFTHPKDLANVEGLSALLLFNPFDQRSVADQSEKEAQLAKKYEEAERQYQAGNLQQAKQICREIISEMPDHYRAIALQATINRLEKEKEKEAVGTTPTPTPTP